MGIRYYAYAFDADYTAQALAAPESVISADPLADAWGLPPGFTSGVTNFEQKPPKIDMLYLDKAWGYLQRLTAPGGAQEIPRPAHRMFEGYVTQTDYGWEPWVKALAPEEVVIVANDLVSVSEELTVTLDADGEDTAYILDFLKRAVDFVTQLATSNRGFAYLIG